MQLLHWPKNSGRLAPASYYDFRAKTIISAISTASLSTRAVDIPNANSSAIDCTRIASAGAPHPPEKG
jgi:hypothetical protein